MSRRMRTKRTASSTCDRLIHVQYIRLFAKKICGFCNDVHRLFARHPSLLKEMRLEEIKIRVARTGVGVKFFIGGDVVGGRRNICSGGGVKSSPSTHWSLYLLIVVKCCGTFAKSFQRWMFLAIIANMSSEISSGGFGLVCWMNCIQNIRGYLRGSLRWSGGRVVRILRCRWAHTDLWMRFSGMCSFQSI